MASATLYYGDIVQILFVAASAVPVLVSANVYRRRLEGRNLFPMFAFVFLRIVTTGNPSSGPTDEISLLGAHGRRREAE